MNSSKRVWIGLGLSVTFLALFFLTVDLDRLLDALTGASYLYVIPAIGTYLVSLFFRTWRWQRLLLHMRKVGLPRLYPVVVVGYMANNLLPMRLGELVRSYYLGEREGVSKMSALVTIVLERLLDALTLLLFIAVAALFVPFFALVEGLAERSSVAWPLLVALMTAPFGIAFGILVLMAYYPTKVKVVVTFLLGPLPTAPRAKLLKLADLFLNGLTALQDPRSVLLLFLISMPIWLLESATFFLIGFSFGLQDVFANPLEMAVAMVLVTAITNIGSSIPAAPGGVGLFELIARETLVLMPLAAVDRAVAGGFTAVVHATILLPPIVLGQVFLWSQHISLGSLSRKGREEPERGVEERALRPSTSTTGTQHLTPSPTLPHQGGESKTSSSLAEEGQTRFERSRRNGGIAS